MTGYEDAMRELLLIVGDINASEQALSKLRAQFLDDPKCDFGGDIVDATKTIERLRREAKELHTFIGDELQD